MNVASKKTVLLLFGGESPEHDVSIASARNIYTAIDKTKITPLLCYIDPSGNWWHTATIDKATDGHCIIPLFGTSQVLIGDKKTPIDTIFPVLHGSNGEDGTIQGLAKLLHTPIVGCDIDGSLLCIDKTLTKSLLASQGVVVAPGRAYSVTALPSFESVSDLGPSLFVKPSRQGSSVGVSKVTDAAAFTNALNDAAIYDSTVLIEAAIEDARELEVAVLGDTHNARASIVGEIIPDREFYNYESKYNTDSQSQCIVPAAIDPTLQTQIQELALTAYRVLHCRGLARVDFLLAADGTLYLNEVNTMPGFTNISMYPKLWQASGIDTQTLIMTLIEQAH